MLYTDGAHLIADSLEELHAYALKMNLNWDWLHYSGKNFHPHFDICGHVRQRVLADAQVLVVSTSRIVELCKLNFRLPETERDVAVWEAHHQSKLDDLHKPTEADYKRMMDNIKKRSGLV